MELWILFNARDGWKNQEKTINDFSLSSQSGVGKSANALHKYCATVYTSFVSNQGMGERAKNLPWTVISGFQMQEPAAAGCRVVPAPPYWHSPDTALMDRFGQGQPGTPGAILGAQASAGTLVLEEVERRL